MHNNGPGQVVQRKQSSHKIRKGVQDMRSYKIKRLLSAFTEASPPESCSDEFNLLFQNNKQNIFKKITENAIARIHWQRLLALITSGVPALTLTLISRTPCVHVQLFSGALLFTRCIISKVRKVFDCTEFKNLGESSRSLVKLNRNRNKHRYVPF